MSSALLEIDATAEYGLVLQQAGQAVLDAVRVKNTGEETLVGMKLVLSSDIGLFHQVEMSLGAVQPGETVSVPIPDGEPKLNYAFLSTLTDVKEGEVCAALVDEEGSACARASAHQTVYPPDQTLGCGRPIYYASFVIPHCDATRRIQADVAKVLEKMTGDAGIVGYLHGKADVYNICKAVYRAVQGLGLSYAVPPATFGQPGQKVRLPDDILKYKTGCCLDTTLLFAAMFELCGLRPVVVLFKDHAFVGCHLTDESFPDPVVTDVEVLRKAVQEDVFVVLETTLVGGDSSFAAAETSAKLKLADASPFKCAVDVALARGMRVYPLPVAPGGGFGEVDGRDVNARDEATRRLKEDIDLDAFDAAVAKDPAQARIDGWAQRLLDLSKANRLLNVRGNARVVPILCPAPAALGDAIAADGEFRVKSYENFLDEEAGRAFQQLEPVRAVEQYREALEGSLRDRELWSVLPRRETERRLKEIYRSARVDLEESGVNTLFLALGALEWREPDAGKRAACCRAPILLVPVKLERRSVADGYRIHRIDEETIVNTTLLEMLRADYQLVVPGLDPLPANDAGVDVEKVLGIFRAAVRNQPGLAVVEDCMVGQFSFGKFVMWKDLTSRNDVIRAHPLVAHLIARKGAYDDGVAVFPAAEVDRHLDYARLCCPLSADSSQLAAVLYSALGKTFVLHGPPGTGKSQTIANIIAHNLSLGRRVLFVSEKKAALDVVYGRVARLGLAPFCLQLHSNKAGKADVYAQFNEALKVGTGTPSGDWNTTVRELESERRKLDAYVKALHRQTVSGFTPYDLFSRLVRGEIDGDDSLVSANARETTAEEYDRARRAIADAAEMREGISAAAIKALARVKPFAWTPHAETRLAEESARLAQELRAAVADLAAAGGPSEKAASFLKRYFGFLKEVRKFEQNVSATYDPEVLRKMPVRDLRRSLEEADRAFFLVRPFKSRALVRAYASAAKDGQLDRGRLREAMKLAAQLQEADAELAKMEPRARELLGEGFDPKTADPDERLEARARAELRLEKACRDVADICDAEPSELVPAKAGELAELAEGIAAHAKGNLRQAFMYAEARRGIRGRERGRGRAGRRRRSGGRCLGRALHGGVPVETAQRSHGKRAGVRHVPRRGARVRDRAVPRTGRAVCTARACQPRRPAVGGDPARRRSRAARRHERARSPDARVRQEDAPEARAADPGRDAHAHARAQAVFPDEPAFRGAVPAGRRRVRPRGVRRGVADTGLGRDRRDRAGQAADRRGGSEAAAAHELLPAGRGRGGRGGGPREHPRRVPARGVDVLFPRLALPQPPRVAHRVLQPPLLRRRPARLPCRRADGPPRGQFRPCARRRLRRERQPDQPPRGGGGGRPRRRVDGVAGVRGQVPRHRDVQRGPAQPRGGPCRRPPGCASRARAQVLGEG